MLRHFCGSISVSFAGSPGRRETGAEMLARFCGFTGRFRLLILLFPASRPEALHPAKAFPVTVSGNAFRSFFEISGLKLC
jgi:hypothetical protein